MDGSRRYSKIYCKTQAGADALTAGRGALSSSARQLLILLDGERDFDELSRIFGEETLYRLLPFLESQGFVEPLNGGATAQDEPPAPPTTTRLGISTALPTTVLTPEPTVTQVAAPPATLSEPLPAQVSAKSPRFLAVPIAILLSLATAAVTVNWVFEREQHAAENPQPAQDGAQAVLDAGKSGKPSSSGTGSVASSSAVRTAPKDSSGANSEPTRSPSPAAPMPATAGQSGSPQASAPAADTGLPLALRGRTNAELTSGPSKTVTSEAIAQGSETNSRPAQRAKAISDSTLEASKKSVPAAKMQPADSEARAAPRPKAPTESASDDDKGIQTQSDTSTAARQGTLALAAPDHASAQNPAPAPAVAGLHVRSRVLPAISKHALESGIYGGKAVVRLHVNTAGAVDRVELVSATPPEVYGPDVQQALEQWTFEPPSNPAQFTLELDFRQQPPTAPPPATAPAPAPASKPADGP